MTICHWVAIIATVFVAVSAFAVIAGMIWHSRREVANALRGRPRS